MISAEHNKQNFADLYTRAYLGDFRLVLELISGEFVCSNALNPFHGPNGIISGFTSQIEALENIRFELEYIFASDDGVGLAYLISGRHIKPLFGFPPSGREIQVRGVSVHKLVNGRSVAAFASANFDQVLTAAYRDAAVEGQLPR